MNVGDLILTTSVTVRDKPVKPLVQMSFKAPKGEAFELLVLGTVKDGDSFDPVAALNALGWIPDPARQK